MNSVDHVIPCVVLVIPLCACGAQDVPEYSVPPRAVPGDLTEQSSLDSIASAYARCASRLRDEGVDLNGYTVTEVVQDMEDARVAFAFDRVNLQSQSYGTRLAMIYAWLYPRSVHRSAMIAVNPPGHFIWYPEIIDEQQRRPTHSSPHTPHGHLVVAIA